MTRRPYALFVFKTWEYAGWLESLKIPSSELLLFLTETKITTSSRGREFLIGLRIWAIDYQVIRHACINFRTTELATHNLVCENQKANSSCWKQSAKSETAGAESTRMFKRLRCKVISKDWVHGSIGTKVVNSNLKYSGS